MHEIKEGMWENAYYFWISQRGDPKKVKTCKYIGLYGWNNYIYRKEHGEMTYCGEIWECEDIFGDIHTCIFRIPYTDDVEELKKKQKFKLTYNYIGENLVEINAHFDGFDAYITKDVKKRNKSLLNQKNIIQTEKIKYLTHWFRSLNNMENKLLKLGIQLYLRRLETPTMSTSREWNQFIKKHPACHKQIINPLKEIGYMT